MCKYNDEASYTWVSKVRSWRSSKVPFNTGKHNLVFSGYT
jgi:hypothetical protein